MVSQLGSACAWALAVILVIAAVGKLVRLDATRASFRALGLPRPAGAAVAVPVAESAVAGALVVVPVVGAWAALALLASFTAFLGVHLARGTTAGCACFGGTAREPISAVAIVRNGFLMILALGALFSDGAGNPGLAATVLVSVGVLIGVAVLSVVDLYVKDVPLWRIDRGGAS